MSAAEPKSKFIPDPIKRSYVYTHLRSLAGILLLFLTFELPHPDHILPAVLLVIIIITSVELSIVIKERTRITLGMGPIFTAVLLFPPPIAAMVAAAGFAPGILTRPAYTWPHRFKMCFSAIGYAILIALASSYTYSHLGGAVPLRSVSLSNLYSVLAALIALNLAQLIILVPSIFLRGAKWRDYINVEFPLITLVNFLSAPTGVLMAYLASNISPWAMLFVAIPLTGAMYLVFSLSSTRDSLKQRIKELNILHEVSSEITRLLKVEQLSDILHVESRKIISSPGFRVALAGDRSNELLIILDVVEDQKRSGYYESSANTFEEHILKTKQPLKADDWPMDAAKLNVQCREEPWVRSYLGVPMIFENKCLGVIGIRSNESFAFSENHLDILRHFANNTAVTIQNSRLYKEVQDSFIGTIEALIKIIDAKDPYTRYHSIRVADLSTEIARRLGLDEEKIESVRLAALLHDIGKVGLPESVLCKRSELNDDERILIRQHPMRGVEIVKGIKKLQDILPSIERHHERMDGNGYPKGITGEHIPQTARIICVADAFDAIISDRPYRQPLSFNEALGEIRRCSGTQFDPEIVGVFEKLHADGFIASLYESTGTKP